MTNWLHPGNRNKEPHMNRTHVCTQCGYVQGEKKLVNGCCRVCGGEVTRQGDASWRKSPVV